MLHWDGSCHQCSITSNNFCSTCGLCFVFSTRYLQREKKKKFSKDFWQVDDRILSWGERSLKKAPKLELGFFESWLQFWDVVTGDGSHRTYFNNSLPPQTVLNSSLPWASTLDFLKILMTKARKGDLTCSLWLSSCSWCCFASTCTLEYQIQNYNNVGLHQLALTEDQTHGFLTLLELKPLKKQITYYHNSSIMTT